MTGIDYFAMFVLLVIICSVVYVFVFLGKWPGQVSGERNHPKHDAIQIGSWVTLIAVPPLWPVVLMWAYCAPKPPKVEFTAEDLEDQISDHKKAIKKLEKQIKEIGEEE